MRGLMSMLMLLAILAGLGVYIYFVDADRDPDADRELVFEAIDADDIQEVEITSAEGETSRARRVDGTWRLVAPVEAPADETELTAIATSLAGLDRTRVVDESATDLAQYGLEPPRIQVSFTTTDGGEPKRLALGERTPTGGDLYARLPGEPRVFLVSSFMDSTFNKGTFALRDKDVIDVDRSAVTAVEYAAGSRRLRLVKTDDEWRLAEPIEARADFAAVEGALERLSSARMQGIVEDENPDLNALGLQPPVATFSTVSGDARATLIFGETENALIYAKDASRPMIFTVAPTLYTDLIRDADEYRRKDLFDARSFTATRVELRPAGADAVVLEKSGEGDGTVWKNAAGAELDRQKVEELLTQLAGLRAESFQADTHAALRSPTLTVAVRFDGDRMEQVMLARAGDMVVASRADEPGTAVVAAGWFEEAMTMLEELE